MGALPPLYLTSGYGPAYQPHFLDMVFICSCTLSTRSVGLLGIIMQRFNCSTGCRVYGFAWQSHFSGCRVSTKILHGNILSDGKPKCTCMTDLNTDNEKRLNRNKHTHTRPFNVPLSRTTRVSQYQKGKTNVDFTEARDSEWQWHQLGHMQVCTSLQTTMPAPHHLVFYRPDALPAVQPTASKHWRQLNWNKQNRKNCRIH